MGRPNQTFEKRRREQKKREKRMEKERRKNERDASRGESGGGAADAEIDLSAYGIEPDEPTKAEGDDATGDDESTDRDDERAD